jgi:hypothetical protein
VRAITACPLPEVAFLHAELQRGAYADCYTTEIARPVSQAQFVEAFYTTALFAVERRLLQWFVAKPSTDMQARELAQGATDAFAAWVVAKRAPDQILLADFTGRTMSWLMAAASGTGGAARTRLYFGSAVLPARSAGSGRLTLGLGFRLLLGFHKLYSRSLLYAARSRLEK